MLNWNSNRELVRASISNFKGTRHTKRKLFKIIFNFWWWFTVIDNHMPIVMSGHFFVASNSNIANLVQSLIGLYNTFNNSLHCTVQYSTAYTVIILNGRSTDEPVSIWSEGRGLLLDISNCSFYSISAELIISPFTIIVPAQLNHVRHGFFEYEIFTATANFSLLR